MPGATGHPWPRTPGRSTALFASRAPGTGPKIYPALAVFRATSWRIFYQGSIASAGQEMRGLQQALPVIVRIGVVAQRSRLAIWLAQQRPSGLFAGQVIARILQGKEPLDLVVFGRPSRGHFDMNRFWPGDFYQQCGRILRHFLYQQSGLVLDQFIKQV